MDATIHDLRFALRSMARTPGFTAVALLMLAIGTGANAAMFSVVDAVMLRSPFVDPDRLAMVGIRNAEGRLSSALSLDQYRSVRESARAFDALAVVVSGQRPVLTGLGLAGAAASTRLIASWLYGVTPLDPATFVASAAGMLAIAAAASYIPARRATRIDPLVALRES